MEETPEKPEKRSGSVKKVASDKKEKQPNAALRYIRETRGEMRKVTWPTREDSQRLTLIVIAVTIVMAIFLGVLDFGFSRAVQALVDLLI
jgi:preprotein translocase subunit SecE